MAELTNEQVTAAEKMSLGELRALAIKEAEAATALPVETTSKEQARDEQGKFVKQDDKQADEIDNSGDAKTENEPSVTIYRKVIDNGNGSVDVYEAESLEGLVDKIAEGKRNANKKIQEFIAEKKQTQAKTEQQIKDENYVVEQKLKTSPAETIKELAKQALAEETEKTRRSQDAQSQFVNTHPDFVPSPDNGSRIVAELQRLGYGEITTEGLEKAYQSLKASGLLKLKEQEANDATATEAKDTQQTVETSAEVTQQRSPKKSSTISTRTSSRTAAPGSVKPTLDEAYKMPMEDLRKLANAQLSGDRS